MNLLFLGSAASEAIPALWCECPNCRKAAALGGRNLRRRTSYLAGGSTLVDFGPDANWQMKEFGIDPAKIERLLVTHSHVDHFNPVELLWRSGNFSVTGRRLGFLANAAVIAELDARVRECSMGRSLDALRLDVRELRPGVPVRDGELEILPVRASHAPKECALNFLLSGRDESRILIANDTGWWPEESWELLRGRTVIGGRAGGVPEMTLEYVMRQNGIVPGADADVDTTVQFNMMAGAFTGGNGDFVTLFEPTATEVAQAGKGYILASVGQESGEIPYTAYFASQTYIREHADVVQRFTNAVARALTWIAGHDAAETAAIIAPQFPDTDVSVLTQVVQRYKDIDAWNATPVMAQSSLERLETVMETAGVLEHADWVDFDRLVDNSYARNAAR